MDHQMFVESVNPGSPAFSGDVHIPYIDLSSGEFAGLSLWNSGGPSSSRHSINNGASEETKMEHGWSSSLTINGNPESRTQERQFETADMFSGSRIEEGRLDASSLGNLNLNLSSNLVDAGDQLFSQNLSALENAAAPFVPLSIESAHVPCSSGTLNQSVSSSSDAESLTERRLSCKRKSIEGVSSHGSGSGSLSPLYQGESSSGQTVSAHQSVNTTVGISGPSYYLSGTHPHPSQEHPISRIATNLTIGVSHLHPYNVMGNVEGSHGNRRIRISPAEHLAPPPNQWPPGNNHWSMQQSCNLFFPFNQPVDSSAAIASGTSNRQPLSSVPPLVQNIHHLPVNLASSSRTDDSSRSPAIAVQRSIAPMNNVLGHSILASPSETRHLIQHWSSWASAPPYQTVTNTRAVQSLAPTLNPPHNMPNQYQHVLPEARQQFLIPFVHSVSSHGQSINVSPVGPSNTFQEIRDQQVAFFRGIQQSYIRSANSVLVDPSLQAVRESRNRVLSEIRNVLARRRDHIQLQGVILFDHAAIYGRATDLHDRHRDMRLDVDNMSYEELLTLEERIGNVNTGLGEEKILKHLKRRKYISLSEEPASEVEPCCICQEEYVEEEEVGRLDCGHDFHTACIKQWLMLKNLCPVCRTTGLC